MGIRSLDRNSTTSWPGLSASLPTPPNSWRVVELIAAVLLLTPRLVWAGAILAMAATGGAILSHLTFLGIEVQGDNGLLFLLAIVVFVTSTVALYLHRKQIPNRGKGSDMMSRSLNTRCQACLQQGCLFLDRVEDETYARPLEGTDEGKPGSSLGAHYRHVLDHFLCLAEGIRTGQVNYDQRRRNPQVENSVTRARLVTEAPDR